ncbi:MAG: sulfur carrier protein ThiS [Rhizobiales bacterium]|nr:sulfur carrier protein ThiS [Hyphomicrobiales bacterium]
MVLIVNGARTETAATSLPALLEELDYQHRHLAIAVNHEVVPRAAWAKAMLNDGDAIEIITPRQGG